jgi:hypothetical protein
MSDMTRILSAIDRGDSLAAEQLLPLVYEELRKLAAQRLAQEKPGQTLQATALVHEAYLRLVGKCYVAGLTVPQAAEGLGVSPRTADLLWPFTRASATAPVSSQETEPLRRRPP